jgi:hypothetical protein
MLDTYATVLLPEPWCTVHILVRTLCISCQDNSYGVSFLVPTAATMNMAVF